jgi:hypothetical protein
MTPSSAKTPMDVIELLRDIEVGYCDDESHSQPCGICPRELAGTYLRLHGQGQNAPAAADDGVDKLVEHCREAMNDTSMYQAAAAGMPEEPSYLRTIREAPVQTPTEQKIMKYVSDLISRAERLERNLKLMRMAAPPVDRDTVIRELETAVRENFQRAERLQGEVDHHAETLAYIKQFIMECSEKCPELARHADVIAFIKNEINPAIVRARRLHSQPANPKKEGEE